MKEIWKDIKGYEKLYQVSNFGRVKSLSRKVKCKVGFRSTKERILKPAKDNQGYLRVVLSDIKQKIYQVHRLVAETFIPNFNNYPCVNHIDENPGNNNALNLEWCTWQYNKEYSAGKKVIQKDKNDNMIKIWNSATEAEKQLKINHISACCKGKRKTAGGYIWRYADDRESN